MWAGERKRLQDSTERQRQRTERGGSQRCCPVGCQLNKSFIPFWGWDLFWCLELLPQKHCNASVCENVPSVWSFCWLTFKFTLKLCQCNHFVGFLKLPRYLIKFYKKSLTKDNIGPSEISGCTFSLEKDLGLPTDLVCVLKGCCWTPLPLLTTTDSLLLQR